uniref:NS3 n=1 Tax=uncultured densovirus TaxID=748192 RepID=A0A7L7YTG9_9VIRU|nr:NS3 [uncultured densovirus]
METLCHSCQLPTNGSYYHRDCFLELTPEDEEVAQLMACEEEMPTEEELMPEMQETTPLSAKAYLEELGYYSEMGESYAENFKRISIGIENISPALLKRVPQGAVHDGELSIFRFLNEECTFLMWKLMLFKFESVVRIDMNCISKFYYNLETDDVMHLGCVDEVPANVTLATASFYDMDKGECQEFIKEHESLFFCDVCQKFIMHNGCENVKEDILKAERKKFEDYHSKVTLYAEEEILCEFKVMYDGLMSTDE